MYTNIPKVESINIVNSITENNYEIDKNAQKEIMHILGTVLEQNYFQVDQEYHKQIDGLAMGAPTSLVLAEIYIQHMEDTQIYPILRKQQIVAYYRYVDHILVIYDQSKTNINYTLQEFNKLQSTINFTIEKEQHESINFLDLTIHRKGKNLQFSIYRKPTQTDIIIPNNSCHPYELKLSAINYLLNRLHVYPITEKAKDIEENTIKNIQQNNGYDRHLVKKSPQKRKKKYTC
jgi:hypothetical protein